MEVLTHGRIATRDDLSVRSVLNGKGAQPEESVAMVWLPDPNSLAVLQALPGAYFVCRRTKSGNRLFLPVHTVGRMTDQTFYPSAFHYGLQILERNIPEKFGDADLLNSYGLFWFLFQRARTMQPFLKRRFQHRKDLEITQGDVSNVLPWEGDPTAAKLGYPTTIDQLIEAGAKLALEYGIVSPSYAERIEFGLWQAAKLENSSPVASNTVNRLIKTTLFNNEDAIHDVSEEDKQKIENAIFDAVKKGIDDDTTMEEFNKWFAGGSSTLVKQIGRQLTDYPSERASELVTSALIELGYRAHHYMVQPIQAMMHDFEHALEEPLNEQEKKAFDLLYYPQPAFGGLPLVLLGERLDTVRLAALELMEDPENSSIIGQLHSLLRYYAMMISPRRAADRERKRRKKYENRDVGNLAE